MITKYHRSLFCVATSLYWFSMYVYVPILPQYAELFGASHKMIGLIIGSYGFMQLVVRIPLGFVSDVLRRRKVFFLLGLALSSLGSLGMYYFTSPVMLLVLRSLTGVAAASWVAITVLFASYFAEDQSSSAVGSIMSFTSIGIMAATLIGGLAAEYYSIYAPFIIAAAGGGIGIILSMGIVETNNEASPLGLPDFLDSARDLHLLLVSLLAIIVQTITWATVYGFTPVVARKIGASDFALGLLTTIAMVPGIVAPILSGSLFARRYGEKKVIIVSFIVLALTCMVIPFIKTLNLLFLAQFVVGFVRGVVFTLLMSLSIKHVEDSKRATYMGFFQSIYALGMFAGPVIVGLLSDLAGLHWGFWVTGASGLLGAWITRFVKKIT